MTHVITFRSVIAGALLAILLCAINSFLTLKFGIMEEGPTIAALFFFAIFVWSGTRITASEMVVVATMGSAGGSLGFIANFYAAQTMVGEPYSFLDMTLFAFVTSIIGLVAAIFLRQVLIVQDEKLPEDQRLPWVPAKAVEEMIRTLIETRDKMQPRYLAAALIGASTYVILNDSGAGIVPEYIGIPLFGLGAYGAAIAFAPLTIGAGYMMGMRTCTGFLVGGIALLVMAPHLPEPNAPHRYVWPGIGFLIGSGIASLLAKWSVITGAVKSLAGLSTTDDDQPIMGRKAMLWFLGVGVGGASLCLYFYFQLTIVIIIAMLAVGGILLNLIAVRAAAQTCFNPARVMGVILQGVCAILGGANINTNLAGAGFVAGSGAQAGNLTGDMAYGRWFKFRPSVQFWLQSGILIPSAITAAAAFWLIQDNFTLALDGGDLAAPIAKIWATAAILFDPESTETLPYFAIEAMCIAGALGALMALLEENDTARKFLPSSMGIGLALILPNAYNFSFFLGGFIMLVIMQRLLKIRPMTLLTIAVGLIVAEGFGGITTGILKTFGVF